MSNIGLIKIFWVKLYIVTIILMGLILTKITLFYLYQLLKDECIICF